MMSKKILKTSFAVDHKLEAFYTGGQVLFTEDGKHMLCRCTEKVNVLEVDTGSIVRQYGKEEDGEISCFTLSQDNKILVLALHNMLLKQYDFESAEQKRVWKAIHTSPISSMAFDVTSTLLATGGSDSTIKVWDVIQEYCTHNLKGHHGVISIVKYHPDPDKLQLFSGGDDYNIRVWDLRTSTCNAILEGHYSVITGLQFSPDTMTLYSSGRDQVVNVWDLKKEVKTRTIPVFETVEAIILLPADGDYSSIGVCPNKPHFVTAGSKGVLRVWNAETSQCVYNQNSDQLTNARIDDESQKCTHNIIEAMYCASLKAIATVSYDHNITLFNLSDLSLRKQFAGYNDEILDIKYLGKNQSHIVVATNSELIKVFDLKTWDVQMLHGHTDIVLALAVYKDGHLFASSSKDNTIRLWKTNADVSGIQCIATAHGHTKGILSLCFSKLNPDFLTSASEDLTIKVWNIPSETTDGEIGRLNARITEKAHDKDINSIDVAPNDKLIATGSQDKTAKLWNVQSLQLLSVFRGHKRGVWCVQFSPVDQCLATSSSDGSVKIWSLSDFTCVRTFEGHDALVLNVQFINRGMQLVTSGSDGLMKLWTIKTSECVKTFDEHQSKIWALAVNRDELQVITGAADSTIIVWKDVTESELEEQRTKQIEFILKEQELLNLIKQKKYVKALALAINLEQPFRVLTIMKEILGDPDGEKGIKKILFKLRQDQLDAVLRFVCQWNTNSKHCHVAQFVLRTVLENMTPEDILQLPSAKSTLEGLLPYTEKHFERMNRLQEQSMFVQYTWNTMKLASDLPEGRTISMSSRVAPLVSELHVADQEASQVQQEGSKPIAGFGTQPDDTLSSEDSSSDPDEKQTADHNQEDDGDTLMSDDDSCPINNDMSKSDTSIMDVSTESATQIVTSDTTECDTDFNSLSSSLEHDHLTEQTTTTVSIRQSNRRESPRKSYMTSNRMPSGRKPSTRLLKHSAVDLEKENKRVVNVTPRSTRNMSTKTPKTDPSKRRELLSSLGSTRKKARKSIS